MYFSFKKLGCNPCTILTCTPQLYSSITTDAPSLPFLQNISHNHRLMQHISFLLSGCWSKLHRVPVPLSITHLISCWPTGEDNNDHVGRSRWPSNLRHPKSCDRHVRIPLTTWIFVSCVCCELRRYRRLRRAVHSSRDGLSSVCVCVCVCINMCDLETSTMKRSRAEVGCSATEEKTGITYRSGKTQTAIDK
jgi:hypothetical protein